MSRLKTILHKIGDAPAYGFLSLFGPAFSDRHYPPHILLRQVWQQKVLRINGHVPWPVHSTTTVKAPGKIQRGDRCPGLSPYIYLDGRNGITIGNNTWLGPRVSLISMNHDMTDFYSYVEEGPIVIGNNCWLGTGAIVLPGVHLGDHVVVAAGAVVTKSFPESDILIGGVPARVIKQIEPYRGQSTGRATVEG